MESLLHMAVTAPSCVVDLGSLNSFGERFLCLLSQFE
jgi:hypothetical protein